jgi:hypothetical protein
VAAAVAAVAQIVAGDGEKFPAVTVFLQHQFQYAVVIVVADFRSRFRENIGVNFAPPVPTTKLRMPLRSSASPCAFIGTKRS